MKRVLVHGLTNSLAGTEAVIVNYVTSLQHRVAFDFIVFEEPTNYAALFESGDNRFFVVPNKRTALVGYYRALRAFFEEHASEYDAVWCNLNILNNIDLLSYGYRYGIPRRILHSHNSCDDGKLHQRVLTEVHKRTVGRYVTDRWACSAEAGEYMFPGQSYIVLPNAIKASDYTFDEKKREAVRRELGFASDATVCGCVGRLAKQKNYAALLSLWPEVCRQNPNMRLVIIGEGELQQDIVEQIAREKIGKTVTLLGRREDIDACLSAFDVYAMPSLHEGLPLSLLEAQFNGLPCVIADTISSEAVISPNVAQLSLDDRMGWVEALSTTARTMPTELLDGARKFDIDKQSDYLEELF